MHIPQIRGKYRSVLIIGVMSFIGGVISANSHGEIRTFRDLPKGFDDGALYAVLGVFAWIFLKSPWAKEFRQLTLEDEKATTTEPSGAVRVVETKKSTETTIAVPDPPPLSPPPAPTPAPVATSAPGEKP